LLSRIFAKIRGSLIARYLNRAIRPFLKFWVVSMFLVGLLIVVDGGEYVEKGDTFNEDYSTNALFLLWINVVIVFVILWVLVNFGSKKEDRGNDIVKEENKNR